MSQTTFQTIEDNYDPGDDWPDGRHDLVTAVIGDLADRIRTITKREGDVTIHEHGVEGGYSEFTVEWDWEFEVRVDDDVVWSTETFTQADFGPNRYRHNSFSQFLEWLDRTPVPHPAATDPSEGGGGRG